ncbi:MAG: hypothetical protein MHM6MM_006310, partial [Cercozoa sp. M6MM]
MASLNSVAQELKRFDVFLRTLDFPADLKALEDNVGHTYTPAFSIINHSKCSREVYEKILSVSTVLKRRQIVQGLKNKYLLMCYIDPLWRSSGYTSSLAVQLEGNSSAVQPEGNSSAVQLEENSSAVQLEGNSALEENSSAVRLEGNSAVQLEENSSAVQLEGNSSAVRLEGNSSAVQPKENRRDLEEMSSVIKLSDAEKAIRAAASFADVCSTSGVFSAYMLKKVRKGKALTGVRDLMFSRGEFEVVVGDVMDAPATCDLGQHDVVFCGGRSGPLDTSDKSDKSTHYSRFHCKQSLYLLVVVLTCVFLCVCVCVCVCV